MSNKKALEEFEQSIEEYRFSLKHLINKKGHRTRKEYLNQISGSIINDHFDRFNFYKKYKLNHSHDTYVWVKVHGKYKMVRNQVNMLNKCADVHFGAINPLKKM